MVEVSKIIGIVVSLLFLGLLLPIGLEALLDMTLPSGVDASVETILLVVLPILVVLGLALAFIPKRFLSKDS